MFEQEDNPFSVDEIEPRLFLGNCTAARNIQFLKSKQISHILTIDSVPIPAYVCSSAAVINKYIHIADMTRENILEHFTVCINFIEGALKDPNGTNGILIHCFYGVSRSATIAIAYLMKKYSINYQKAFELAKSKRRLVQPNHGFVLQLKLFHKMAYEIDPTYKNYKIFRLKLAAEQVKSVKILPSSFLNLLAPDPVLHQERPDPNVYRCRKCRRIVASKSNLILHKPKDQINSFETSHLNQKGKPNNSVPNLLDDEQMENQNPTVNLNEAISELAGDLMVSTISEKLLKRNHPDPQLCTKMYFIEPMIWMKDVPNNVEGKLYCPQCKSKIGSFNWIMASKCPCGAQVSPSFYLVPSKIEYSNIVQNMQVTV
ncbi:CLUMA_CG012683, isoform A [Clunio marinus]|uniref:CLUMA_CG012683, isoform A n=1 Tax=Clunio marinus TaxID=568069 RepID=A0A1J1IGV1_9DIPT|nr:CLUMA_CG012683, isoform A [Clunio marinus]